MLHTLSRPLLGAVALVVALTMVAPARAVESGESTFYKAYYLEHELRDYDAAAGLYEKAAAASSLDATLRERAKQGLVACREELACSDFARLMPPHTLVYAELNEPGRHIEALAGALGLLRGEEDLAQVGARRIAVSPALIHSVLGLRGVAVGLTGFDPLKKVPAGVAILHPGDVNIVRGFLETGLPAGGQLVERIDGHETYLIEKKVYVTLTSRLAIVGTHPDLVRDVVRRLKGDDRPSLASNEVVREAMETRKDALLFVCVNAKALMPIVAGPMAMMGGQNREVAMAQMMLDPQSLEWATVRVRLGVEGFSADVTLQLAEGHRNLVYNFLRLPPVTEDTLRCIPEGAAAFGVVALNEATWSMGGGRSAAVPAGAGSAGTHQPMPISAMDLGREVFGNIVSAGVYVLPPSGDAPAGGLPIPDAALAITVNDPARSEALWSQMLAIASVAAGVTATPGGSVRIGDHTAQSYALPQGITVYVTTVGHELLVSPSRVAIERSIAARDSGRSVLDDAAFAPSLREIGPHTSKALFVHPGRCLAVAKRFIPPHELAKAALIEPLLRETVVAAVVNQSDRRLQLSARVTGVPKIGGLISQMAFGGGLGASQQYTTTTGSSPAPSGEGSALSPTAGR
jgi:hypothetical protein